MTQSVAESLARAYAGTGALESAVALLEEACEQARARNAPSKFSASACCLRTR